MLQESELPSWALELRVSAASVRKAIAQALHVTGGGHYGGSFSAVEVLLLLYTRHLRIKPDNIGERDRDRFILSKGHAAIGLYAVLRECGLIDDPLASYASFGSPLEGHPDMTAMAAVDWSTGSLGQGLSAAIGMAVGLRSSGRKVWVMLGDGECQEGQVWEAAMLAGLLNPGNLHAVVDVNRHQEFGWRLGNTPHAGLDPVPNLADKWRSFGWDVLECDGHDLLAVDETLAAASYRQRPSVVLAWTNKGHGSRSVMQDPARFHCTSVSDSEHAAILMELTVP